MDAQYIRSVVLHRVICPQAHKNVLTGVEVLGTNQSVVNSFNTCSCAQDTKPCDGHSGWYEHRKCKGKERCTEESLWWLEQLFNQAIVIHVVENCFLALARGFDLVNLSHVGAKLIRYTKILGL